MDWGKRAARAALVMVASGFVVAAAPRLAHTGGFEAGGQSASSQGAAKAGAADRAMTVAAEDSCATILVRLRVNIRGDTPTLRLELVRVKIDLSLSAKVAS